MKSISKEIGIDLGTSCTRISIRGRGTILSEPTVVAINKITGEILAVGNQAKEMLGRTPDSIVAVRPLKDGIIADFEATRMLIQNLVYRVVPKSLFYKPKMIITIPSAITDVEERAVEGVGYKAGAKAVYLMEEVMAAAIGAGLQIDRPEGCMIVDIGGGTSEMAVLSLGGIVTENSVKIAGDKLDRDIVEYIRTKFNVLIGQTEAEEIKKQIGTASSAMTEEKVNIKGRNLSTGLPETVTVTTFDINLAIKDSLEIILKAIKTTLENTPPELSSDVMSKGIVLSGSGSLLKNLDRYINEQTGIPVYIAESPSECVSRGVAMSLDNIEVLKKSVKSRRI
ncbi:MAG: rod shape-determining protein [Clostridia bacterium]